MSFWSDSFTYEVCVEPLHVAIDGRKLYYPIVEIMWEVFDERLLEKKIEEHLEKKLAEAGISEEEIKEYIDQGVVLVEPA